MHIYVCVCMCTYKYMCIYYVYTRFQVERKFTSFVNYAGKLLCRMTWGVSTMMKKKSVWPYYHSVKRTFSDFHSVFIVQASKLWSFAIMPSPESMPRNHLSMIQFWFSEYSHHQLPFPIPTESSRLWEFVCVTEPLQSFFMTLLLQSHVSAFNVFFFFNSMTDNTWLVFACLHRKAKSFS